MIALKDKICRKYCYFFKDEKNLPLEEKCGTFKFFNEYPSLIDSLSPEKRINREVNEKIIEFFCKPLCDYYIKDCDWTNPKIENKIEPCGGFYFLQEIFNKFVVLSENFFIKRLEKDYLFDRKNDDLYELDDKALDFFKNCNGKKRLHEIIKDFEVSIELLKDKIIKLSHEKHPREVKFYEIKPPLPSLRYLEIQLTYFCNLNCKHCYLGKNDNIHLDFDLLKRILDEFEEMNGLRVLFSGGEPFLYDNIEKLIEILDQYSFRRVFLTNGTIIKEELLRNIDQIQISIDGLQDSHDFIRGKGCFKKVFRNIEKIKEQNIDISIATMIHKKNLNEFDQLEMLVKDIGAIEWGIDVPVIEGNFKNFEYLKVSPEEAKYPLSKKFGGSFHEPAQGFACGAHYSTIFPDGKIAKCGFYYDKYFGDLKKQSLRDVIKQKNNIKLNEIECSKLNCKFIDECRGGCRFRAGDDFNKDEYMCVIYQT